MKAARIRMALIMPALGKRNGVTGNLKVQARMEWKRQTNACKARAEEIMKYELVYVCYRERADEMSGRLLRQR